MTEPLKIFTDFLARSEAERRVLSDELSGVDDLLGRLAGAADARRQARDIVCEVLAATQGQAAGYVEDVVSLALSSVYGDDYAFKIDYEVKRNQPEATPWIVVGGERFSPREEVGGGVLDVAALALRLALWSLMEPRPAPVFVLDEPGRFLAQDKQVAFGRMLRELSDMLGLQILLVSHSDGIIESADKAYVVTQTGGVSTANLLQTTGE